MPVNPFFSNASTQDQNEKSLYEDLTIEVIQIAGTDFMYLQKSLVNLDDFFGEDASMEFNQAIEIEMYIENSAEYQGERNIMQQFGLENRKKLNINVAVKRFQETFNMVRPKEGDWLYSPITKDLFEITLVDDQPQIYGVGTQNFFRLTVQSIEYSHETINTGFDEIDKIGIGLINDGTDSNGLKNDKNADNDLIETISNDEVDYSEISPFGSF